MATHNRWMKQASPSLCVKKYRPGRNRRDDADDREGVSNGRRNSCRRRTCGDGRTSRYGRGRRSPWPKRRATPCRRGALGEADETWPRIVEDAARGQLKDVYAPVDAFGQERKPSLQEYPAIPWDKINLGQFNLVPKMATRTLQRIGDGWGTFRIIPMESGRGCPYGCEFCTVTGFFGDSIRFRTNESVVNELLLLKAVAKSEGGKSPSSSSTIISRSISSARNHCCATSSRPTRRCTGWRKSAPICCAMRNSWT